MDGNEIDLFFKLESTAMDVSNLIGKYLNISVGNEPGELMRSPQVHHYIYNIHRFNRKTISRQQFVVIATHLSTI